MIELQNTDKERIIEILTFAFESNASVNYIVNQDEQRMERIRNLMRYSVRVCSVFGKVVLSDDRNAAALVMHGPKGFSLRALLWELELIFRVSGLSNLKTVLRREALIKAQHPLKTFYYLWFIGVHPAHRGHGIGSDLLVELLADAERLGLPVYLETSAIRNVPWYEKFGF
ncbi:GNAT superfamily N-acetyltransferase [Pedobacter sp. AK017]|uniref:GNAT family N-acetyltransferase n=1 Tax=Pedobacter sp. AK017 TaxID=2723073 RepID=UPI0016150B78|nr:GNAT family N-acetyltransferase [Pedobacter sp. AK017]MBB5440658.1 GNAT superfamily N-acetyltransferase [Pedobacter sp. AK017]